MDLSTLFPTTFDWATIQGGITGLIGNTVVISGLAFVLATRLAPRAVRALRSMVR